LQAEKLGLKQIQNYLKLEMELIHGMFDPMEEFVEPLGQLVLLVLLDQTAPLDFLAPLEILALQVSLGILELLVLRVGQVLKGLKAHKESPIILMPWVPPDLRVMPIIIK
jgi:hypothetical protein